MEDNKIHITKPSLAKNREMGSEGSCYKKDSIAKTKWIDMASNQNVRPYQSWYVYSDVTTGVTVPRYSAEPEMNESINFTNAEITVPKVGSTSLPARAVYNFDSKQQMTLFPRNRPFFVFDVPISKRQELTANEAQFTLATELAAGWVMEFLRKSKKVYDIFPNVFNLLTVTGNGLVFMGHKKSDKAIFIPPTDYVTRRSDAGEVKELIIREVIAYVDMDESLRKIVMDHRNVSEETFSNKDNGNNTEPETLQKFTYVIFNDDGSCKYAEYLEETMISDFKNVSKNEPRFIVLAPTLPPKAQYGVGVVQHMMASIRQVQSGGKAMATVNDLIAEAKMYAKPSMVNAIRAMQKGESGRYVIVNDPNDIGYMSWANINTTTSEKSIQMATQEIAKTFIMTSDAVRDAERVTAAEIRRLADDITAVHNNWLHSLSVQLQEKLVKYAIFHMDLKNPEGKEVKSALQELDVHIITGTDAIDRVSESDNLIAVFQEIAVFSALPPEEKMLFNKENVVTSLIKARGISAKEMLKSEEQLAAEMQRAQEAQLAQQGQQAQIDQLSKGQPE